MSKKQRVEIDDLRKGHTHTLNVEAYNGSRSFSTMSFCYLKRTFSISLHFGYNLSYFSFEFSFMCVCPCIMILRFRFREDTPEILKLREKEKGDWKKMTIPEKKALYRAAYCQTIAEVRPLLIFHNLHRLGSIYRRLISIKNFLLFCCKF